ncbi:phosphatase 2C-like domain-containing protein [Chytridium lagenaria]|nr:phosphatase 2C-like domain-containing protein [Chytridium lagenaria]
MGQTLSEPIKEKHSSSDKDDRLYYGASSMQGWRITMEDAHTTLLDVLSDMDSSAAQLSSEAAVDPKKRMSFFAVYDGHGGANVAEYSGKFLHKNIVLDKAFETGNYREAIKNGFLRTDEELRRDPDQTGRPAGCTAVTTLITDDWRLFCGNAGDSRAVLSRNGKAVALSFDHKPMNADELKRIKEAGGFVEFGRVNGNLALSRAIGDFEYKQKHDFPAERQIVTADPEIHEHQLSPGEDEFIVVACDGIWDCMTNQRVVDFVRRSVATGRTLSETAEDLMEHCVAQDLDFQTVGADNMTVLIVALINGRSIEEWSEEVRERVGEISNDILGGLEDEVDETVEEPSPTGFSLKNVDGLSPYRAGADREPILRH